MNHEIYFPILKSIEVEEFWLYEQKPTFKFEFINGVNLVIGGNGVGKTTFINLIKYGLIGLYKKDVDVRVYLGRKIEKRTQYSKDFFRNRMDSKYSNKNARIILNFKINNVEFQVKRNLNDIILEEVIIIENGLKYKLNGKIVSQHSYESINNIEEKQKYLQYKYEAKICELVNLQSFDDFIFFVNKILFFGEDRETILWNIVYQDRLASKYFNDPILDKEFEEAKINAKYHDSLSRHTSEEIKAINRVMNKIEFKISDDEKGSKIQLIKESNQIKHNIELDEKRLQEIQNQREYIENSLSIKFSERNKCSRNIQTLQEAINEKELIIHKKLWENLNPQYEVYLENAKLNHICPLCNKELNEKILINISQKSNECIFCNSVIYDEHEDDTEIINLKANMEEELTIKQGIEKQIYNLENELKKLDGDFNNIKLNLFNLSSKLRSIEVNINTPREEDKDKSGIEAIQNELLVLEIRKAEEAKKSSYYLEKSKKIMEIIDDSRKSINNGLSKIFSEFAESFLQLPCYLTYEDLDNQGKRCIPIINKKPRLYEEELSESQRFFIDHSFRMSILNYFNSSSSFFICETPDSSLDISYEVNAANIFLKYIERPNILILTSNINNSEFLQHIIDNATNINYINLLEIGKKSTIQGSSNKLNKISKKIEEKLHGKSSII